jgi:hypothetical protein
VVLNVLTESRLPTAGLRIKSWSEFARPDAPVMFVSRRCRTGGLPGVAGLADDRALEYP